MHPSTKSVSRYAESVLTAGVVAKKGTAANGVTAVTATTDKPAGLTTAAKVAADVAAGGDASIALVISGPATGLAGATVAIGDDVVVDATGKLVPKSVAGYVVGTATTGAANGEYFELLVNIRKEPA